MGSLGEQREPESSARRPERRRSGVVRRVQDRLSADPRYPRWVLLTGLAGIMATTFPITVLGVAVADIAEDLGTTSTMMSWVITAPMLFHALAMPILGKLGDLYGHRRIYLVGFSLAILGALLTSLAWGPIPLIVLRTLSQMIGAATIPASLALIMSVHAPEERAKATGWWSLAAAGAPLLGLVGGGPMIDAVGWRWLFVIQAGLALLTLIPGVFVLRETDRKERVSFDIPGSLSLALTVGAVVFAFNRGAEWGWLHPGVLFGVVVAPVALLMFVRAERRVDMPLLPLEYFRRRNFAMPLVAKFALHFSYMGGFILVPLLVQSVLGYSLSMASMIMLFRPLFFAAAAPLGGRASTWIGERYVAVIGAGAIMLSMGLFTVGAWAGSIVVIIAGLAASGAGNGFSQPALVASAANAVEDEDLGIASGTVQMLGQVGGVVGIGVLTAIQGASSTVGAHMAAFIVGGAVAFIAVVATTFLRSTNREGSGSPDGEGAPDEEHEAAPEGGVTGDADDHGIEEGAKP